MKTFKTQFLLATSLALLAIAPPRLAAQCLDFTSTSVTSSPNPSIVGNSVTFTAAVRAIGNRQHGLSGTVSFWDGTTFLGSSSAWVITTSTLTVGTHSITANYNGSYPFCGSTSSPLNQWVFATTSSTALALTTGANPSAYGQPVTFSASVISYVGTPTPTGTVTFNDGAVVLGTSALNGSAQAVITAPVLSLGTHSITAVYSGDTNFGGSTSSVLSQKIVPPSITSLTLTMGTNPSSYGQSVTFTASVSFSAGMPAPTGMVTFYDGAASLQITYLNGNTASYTFSSLSVGTHSITAVYSGDANYVGSTSSVLSQTVLGVTVALTTGTNPSTYGQSLIFSATVTSSAGTPTPTGTVTFQDGAVTLASQTLNGSAQAAITISSLSVGTHSITAVYGGDSNFSGSTSPPLSQTVNQGVGTATSVLLAVSPNRVTFRTQVTYTATVTPSTATGTVEFIDGITTVGSGTLSSGVATFSTNQPNQLAIGQHVITASYGGDAKFSGNSSPAAIFYRSPMPH